MSLGRRCLPPSEQLLLRFVFNSNSKLASPVTLSTQTNKQKQTPTIITPIHPEAQLQVNGERTGDSPEDKPK